MASKHQQNVTKQFITSERIERDTQPDLCQFEFTNSTSPPKTSDKHASFRPNHN